MYLGPYISYSDRFLWFSLDPREITGLRSKMGYVHFLQHPFQFIVH
jgi:hypothetical protein